MFSCLIPLPVNGAASVKVLSYCGPGEAISLHISNLWMEAFAMPKLDRGFKLTWLGHNSFWLTTRDGCSVLLDPWVESNPACPKELQSFERIDVMTITHGHADHMADAGEPGEALPADDRVQLRNPLLPAAQRPGHDCTDE
jgi:glyoxylase-like metal-dependent hydrolase (beta-lactamase superfamily II)